MKNYILTLSLIWSVGFLQAQYWQQAVDYTIEVELDTETAQYKGNQKLIYTNNSPETLHKVFYHLYFNAFQPGSEMAIRLKNSADKNRRFKISIDSLSEEQQGFLKVSNLKQDGLTVETVNSETILEVKLNQPLLPGESTALELNFEGQVPDVIRRAGKNSAEGVAFSMAQWYPKMAEYDIEGWNTDPYTGREFHGVWGDFDVKITLNKDYTVAASGYLQNAQDIGKGYSDRKKSKSKKGKITWHFVAPQVHDFTWAADADYIHDTYPGPNGVALHFFYKNDPEIIENWKKLQADTAKMMAYYNTKIGPYPYDQYSVVQGGDGGMEYAMLTLITGSRSYGSLFGVTAHELAHSWFQHILATNETKHEWMDEGFTSFISALASNEILEQNKEFPLEGSYRGYFNLVNSGFEMPQSTNANRYKHNLAYESTAYSKGAVFLGQLGYVVGNENLFKILQAYYKEWQFKHPQPNDLRRIAERVSGLQLQWYLTDWTQTTNTINYAITGLQNKGDGSVIHLERKELMPMPQEVLVVYKNGDAELHYIPISLMRGEKENNYSIEWIVQKDWAWANPKYDLVLTRPKESIETIILDPSGLMADIDKNDNFYVNSEEDSN
ncbi:M1 family metallopeptidase [Flavobacteriaceae bacterium]|nr:M1 family metallopeptidase [Flavobacteriaceae bacterium]MDC3354231.1 M1 family metallopeptidase [Flavobacteriaceae bacterium]